MKYDLIQMTVRLNINNSHTSTEIIKSGPQAVTAAEALLLHVRHSLGENPEAVAIRNAVKVGEVEMSKSQLLESLRERYGAKLVDETFQRGRHLPSTLADLELPEECLGKPRVIEAAPAAFEGKAEKREALVAAGIDLPKGNISESDLDALIAEHGIEPVNAAA